MAKSPQQIASDWLESFEQFLVSGSPGSSEIFADDAHWRDIVAFTWDLRQEHGSAEIGEAIREAAAIERPKNLRLAPVHSAPTTTTRFHREVVEAIFDFDTRAGVGRGVVRLLVDETAPAGARAWLLLTTLQALEGAGKHWPDDRSRRYGYVRKDEKETWAEARQRIAAYTDRDPEVVVVGAGHSGLMVAAQLDQLGVDTLLIDKLPRVGDGWRNRPRTLALHNPSVASNFPFMPYASTFPQYLSKDKIGNWLETYAEALDLNVWTSTELVDAHYDDEAHRWETTVRRNGESRTFRPRHVIMATGAFGQIPTIPDLPGLSEFGGTVIHTAAFQSGEDYAGQRVLIVGVGTSAHDAAQDLHNYGAKVTMLQRSPITVIDLPTMEKFPSTAYPPGAPMDEIDLLAASNLVFPLAREAIRENTQRTDEADAELITKLREAGLRVDAGPDEGGWQLRAWRIGSGYYINVGGSELIIDGGVEIIQAENTDRFVENGLRMNDGTTLEFDTVVLATGYLNLQADLAQIFGEELSESIGPVFQLDDYGTGEWTNSWAPTAQEGLWFCCGGLAQTRPYSLYMALNIKARLDGLIEAGQSTHRHPIPVWETVGV